MTILKDQETIVFIGDSITDSCHREGPHRPLGAGYVNLFSTMLSVREPEKQLNIINTGLGGNTVEDLRDRWYDDALSYKPEYLSLKVGINDCARWVKDGCEMQSPAKFAEIYDEILAITVKKLPSTQILLIDPFFASFADDSDMPETYRGKMLRILPEYLDVVNKMSEKYQTRHIKTHEIFRNHFKYQHPSVFFPHEPVHPNFSGYMLIAEHVFNAFEA
jgi:acyl-CoA thioesterase I